MYYRLNGWIFFFSIIYIAAAVPPSYIVTDNAAEYSGEHEKKISNNNNIESDDGKLRQLFKPGVRDQSGPCSCADGQCGCCTGSIMSQLNVNINQRGCVNITFIPEEYAFNVTMRFNDRLIYQNQMSARNPRPVCIPLYLIPGNLFRDTEFCVRIFDIRLLDNRNMYWCLRVYFRFPWAPDGANGLSGEHCYSFGFDGYVVDPSTTRKPTIKPSETPLLPSITDTNSSELTFRPTETSSDTSSKSPEPDLNETSTPLLPSSVSNPTEISLSPTLSSVSPISAATEISSETLIFREPTSSETEISTLTSSSTSPQQTSSTTEISSPPTSSSASPQQLSSTTETSSPPTSYSTSPQQTSSTTETSSHPSSSTSPQQTSSKPETTSPPTSSSISV